MIRAVDSIELGPVVYKHIQEQETDKKRNDNKRNYFAYIGQAVYVCVCVFRSSRFRAICTAAYTYILGISVVCLDKNCLFYCVILTSFFFHPIRNCSCWRVKKTTRRFYFYFRPNCCIKFHSRVWRHEFTTSPSAAAAALVVGYLIPNFPTVDDPLLGAGRLAVFPVDWYNFRIKVHLMKLPFLFIT